MKTTIWSVHFVWGVLKGAEIRGSGASATGKRQKTQKKWASGRSSLHFRFTMFSGFRMIVTSCEHGGMLRDPINKGLLSILPDQGIKELEVSWPLLRE